MSFFRCKVGDEQFELEKLTLGEARILKTEFGMEDFEEFNPGDPDQLVGLLYLCLRKKHPADSKEALIERVEALDISEFGFDDEDEGADPTVAADDAAPVGETTPVISGVPSSAASTA